MKIQQQHFNSGISEKAFININGQKMGMFIKSENLKNPLLLFLHGGLPEYYLDSIYPTDFEKHFTVVWWDQRGSGLSYNRTTSAVPITLKQMISDTVKITHYLCCKYNQKKIYLMGHSGGSFVGIQTVAQNPELYYAYLGVAQMVDQLKSEILAYKYMLRQFQKNRDYKMVRKLLLVAPTINHGVPDGYLKIRDLVMHKLGVGTTRNTKSVFTGVFIPSWFNRDYSLIEKINLWQGKFSSGVSCLWPEMIATNLRKRLTKLDIPAYFFHGKYDYTCSYSIARDYFNELKTPLKGFYSFTRSAHSPMFEEPNKMQKILYEDVLTGKNRLADN